MEYTFRYIIMHCFWFRERRWLGHNPKQWRTFGHFEVIENKGKDFLLFPAFLLELPARKIMMIVPWNPHWDSGRILSAIIWCQFRRILTKPFPVMENNDILLEFPQAFWSSFMKILMITASFCYLGTCWDYHIFKMRVKMLVCKGKPSYLIKRDVWAWRLPLSHLLYSLLEFLKNSSDIHP